MRKREREVEGLSGPLMDEGKRRGGIVEALEGRGEETWWDWGSPAEAPHGAGNHKRKLMSFPAAHHGRPG